MDKITKVSVPGVPEPEGNIYSNCLKVGNQLILSGMIAADTSGDAYQQSIDCFEKIKALIVGAGGRMEDVAKLNIYLTDMETRPAFGKARGEYFSGRMPCSTLVAITALAAPGALVEGKYPARIAWHADDLVSRHHGWRAVIQHTAVRLGNGGVVVDPVRAPVPDVGARHQAAI